ncbi:MAG: SLC26A/SulP transporter family protein [Cyanobacteria bacterium CRU_2_1]|nr:SLC26A/SulP transporter family protein [Cyanobacteria bacterium CRU_2_1]
MTITLGTLLTGLFLFTMGQLCLGRWARFIPYTVIGGFMAGTGWLIVRSSFKVMVAIPPELSQLPALLQPDVMSYWLAGLGFAVVVLAAMKYSQHVLTLPLVIGSTIALANLLAMISDAGAITRSNWFLQAFPQDQLWHCWQISPAQIDWGVLTSQSGTLLAMMAVVVIAILLNATGVELATQRDSHLDSELRTNGIANLVTGCFGGMVGHFSMNRTLLNRNAGASSPLAGVMAATLCGSVLVCGSGFLPYIPKFVLGGLLLSIGFRLLYEWVYSARSKFPPLEYALILIILVSIAVWGFIEGVGVGIIIACALFAFNYSRLQVVRHVFSGATHQSNVRRSFPEQRLLRQKGDQIYVLLLQGYIFFGTANALLEQVKQRINDSDEPPVQFLVLDFRLVSGLDSSVVLSFTKMRQLTQKHQIQMVLTQLQPTMQHQLQQGGCVQPDETLIHLLPDLDRGIEWCEDQILETSPLRRRRSLPLALQFNDVFASASQVSTFMTYLDQVQVPVGHLLFREGDSSDALYFIESGQVTVFLQLENGQTRRIRTLSAGTMVGEIAFYLDTPHKTSVVTDQPSKLYRLADESLTQMQRDHPLIASAFQEFVIRLLADRLVYAYDEIEELL